LWFDQQTNRHTAQLTSPTSISKMSTPRPHQSTDRVYEVSVSTSGARNSGVPQNVDVLSPWPMPSLHRPKSAILTKPSASSNRLSSFKSLQHEPVQRWVLRDKANLTPCGIAGCCHTANLTARCKYNCRSIMKLLSRIVAMTTTWQTPTTKNNRRLSVNNWWREAATETGVLFAWATSSLLLNLIGGSLMSYGCSYSAVTAYVEASHLLICRLKYVLHCCRLQRCWATSTTQWGIITSRTP